MEGENILTEEGLRDFRRQFISANEQQRVEIAKRCIEKFDSQKEVTRVQLIQNPELVIFLLQARIEATGNILDYDAPDKLNAGHSTVGISTEKLGDTDMPCFEFALHGDGRGVVSGQGGRADFREDLYEAGVLNTSGFQTATGTRPHLLPTMVEWLMSKQPSPPLLTEKGVECNGVKLVVYFTEGEKDHYTYPEHFTLELPGGYYLETVTGTPVILTSPGHHDDDDADNVRYNVEKYSVNRLLPAHLEAMQRLVLNPHYTYKPITELVKSNKTMSEAVDSAMRELGLDPKAKSGLSYEVNLAVGHIYLNKSDVRENCIENQQTLARLVKEVYRRKTQQASVETGMGFGEGGIEESEPIEQQPCELSPSLQTLVLLVSPRINDCTQEKAERAIIDAAMSMSGDEKRQEFLVKLLKSFQGKDVSFEKLNECMKKVSGEMLGQQSSDAMETNPVIAETGWTTADEEARESEEFEGMNFS